jgi:hypothetical protein
MTTNIKNEMDQINYFPDVLRCPLSGERPDIRSRYSRDIERS